MALQKVLVQLGGGDPEEPPPPLIGVGFSMGAIVLSNYVASYGKECALDGAISLSGGLDMRFQENFERAKRLWQPMLAETLRSDFLLGKWGKRVQARLSKDEMLRMMRATHITVRFNNGMWISSLLVCLHVRNLILLHRSLVIVVLTTTLE